MNQNNVFIDSLDQHIIIVVAFQFSIAFKYVNWHPFSFEDPFNLFAFIISATPSFIIIKHPFPRLLLAAFSLHHLYVNPLAIIAPYHQNFLKRFHFDFDLIILLPLLITFNRRSFFKINLFLILKISKFIF